MSKFCLAIYTLLMAITLAPMVSADIVSEHAPKKPLVLLISIDGFKPDYLERGLTPTLNDLAEQGVLAKGLIPSFPSVTFPNHYSIVTGLTPDHHGIVNNTMYDPNIKGEVFKLSSDKAVSNPQWWQQAKPIWVSAKQQGVITSTLFWPGTGTLIHNEQPDDWLKYDGQMSSVQRVSKLLSWLNRPDDTRAGFATLYFNEVDSAGHKYGPNGVVTNNAIEQVDNALDYLLQGLDSLNLTHVTSLIIVSDHGMAQVEDNKLINIKPLLQDYPEAKIRWTGAFAGVDVSDEQAELVLAILKKQKHMDCWKKKEMPERFKFGQNKRIPKLFCLVEQGWFISDKQDQHQSPVMGMHGYDPALTSMQGLFIASGYRIKQTDEPLPPFVNVDVYPLLISLAGLKAENNDGDPHLLSLITDD